MRSTWTPPEAPSLEVWRSFCRAAVEAYDEHIDAPGDEAARKLARAMDAIAYLVEATK